MIHTVGLAEGRLRVLGSVAVVRDGGGALVVVVVAAAVVVMAVTLMWSGELGF